MYKKEYKDDSSIQNDAELWRRVPPGQIIFDQNRGCKRPTSQAFNDSSDDTPMSVHLATMARPPSEVIKEYPGFSVAAFTAGFARECGQGVVHDPIIPDDPSHAFVFGRKTSRIRKKFALEARWVLAPGLD